VDLEPQLIDLPRLGGPDPPALPQEPGELEVSYVHSRAKGDAEDYNQVVGNDTGLGEDVAGFLDYDVRDAVKVNGPLAAAALEPPARDGAVASVGNAVLRHLSDVPAGHPASASATFTVQYGRRRSLLPHGTERNDQRNEPYYNVDVGLRKDLPIKSTDLTLSIDVFNLLNDRHARHDDPDQRFERHGPANRTSASVRREDRVLGDGDRDRRGARTWRFV
jgi:hypothetical protein